MLQYIPLSLSLSSPSFCALRRCLVPIFAKTPAGGAVPVVFCATSAEVAAHPGAVWTEGPRVKLMPLKKRCFNDKNRDAAWSAINAAIKATGRSAW